MMMPEQVLAILADQSGHLASSPSPSALVDSSHQAKPSSFFFFLLLFFFWLSCFSLDVVQQQTTQTDPAGILCIFFFHLFIGSSSKVTRILLCSAPTPAK
jgi:hypothetical protein